MTRGIRAGGAARHRPSSTPRATHREALPKPPRQCRWRLPPDTADGRNHPRRQTRARSRAPGAAVAMRTMRLVILFDCLFGTAILRRSRRAVGRVDDVGAEPTAPSACWWAARPSSTSATPIARVSLTSADIADALVTSPNQLLINGKMPGTISMFVWDRAGGIRRYEVVVQRDLARLNEQMQAAVSRRGDRRAEQRQERSCCPGMVSSKDVDRQGGQRRRRLRGQARKRSSRCCSSARARASNQVLLRVRFAEVSRSAMTELGASLFTGAERLQERPRPRRRREQLPAPTFDNSDPGELEADLQRLPEPVPLRRQAPARRGHQGAADQGPVPEPGRAEPGGRERQGSQLPRRRRVPGPDRAGLAAATWRSRVQFKEFGIRLNFTPVVNGDRVHLKVRPEVSTLDFANAVVLNGFRIPALSTRRTETELELQNGQTFAIAGLLNNTVNIDAAEDPGHRRHPDSRPAVQEQGGAEGPDRAGRDDHAGDSAEELARRDDRRCRARRSRILPPLPDKKTSTDAAAGVRQPATAWRDAAPAARPAAAAGASRRCRRRSGRRGRRGVGAESDARVRVTRRRCRQRPAAVPLEADRAAQAQTAAPDSTTAADASADAERAR